MVLPVLSSQKKSFSTTLRRFEMAVDLIEQVNADVETIMNSNAPFSDKAQTYLNLKNLFSGKNGSVADLNKISAFQEFCSDFQEQLATAGKSISVTVPKPNSEGGSSPLLINGKPATLFDVASALSDDHTAFTAQVDLRQIEASGFSPYWGSKATNKEGNITWTVNHSDFWGGDYHVTAQGSAENWIECAGGTVTDGGQALHDLKILVN